MRKSETAKYLESKAQRILEYIDRKDFSNPEIRELAVPEFAAYLPHSQLPYINSLEEYLENYRVFARDNPDYYCEALSFSASVNEKNGTASVWVLLRVTGHPKGLQRENITIVSWKRKQGQWRAYKQIGMRWFGGCFDWYF